MPGMMGGMPPKDPIKNQMSMLNPTDLTMMSQEGRFSQDMTVRDAMSEMGIDVDGPVQQLFDLGKKQVQNANPLNKAKNMAKQQAPMPPQGQGEEPSLDSLLKGI